jgi:phosphoribosylglycinamide formyltransferase-1
MRVAFYTSGKSGRLVDFYKWIRYSDYPFEFCYYDGNDKRIIDILKCSSPNAIIYEPSFQDLHVKSSIFSQKLSDEILLKLEEHYVDYLFCFGDKLLKGDLLKKYKGRIINFHPSLLPAFPGLNAVDKALDKKVKFLGNTAHIVDAGIDTGQIILQSILKISDFHN